MDSVWYCLTFLGDDHPHACAGPYADPDSARGGAHAALLEAVHNGVGRARVDVVQRLGALTFAASPDGAYVVAEWSDCEPQREEVTREA